jgi:hypothetical protein
MVVWRLLRPLFSVFWCNSQFISPIPFSVLELDEKSFEMSIRTEGFGLISHWNIRCSTQVSHQLTLWSWLQAEQSILRTTCPYRWRTKSFFRMVFTHRENVPFFRENHKWHECFMSTANLMPCLLW